MSVGLHMPPYISAHVPPALGSCERYLTASAYQQLHRPLNTGGPLTELYFSAPQHCG